MRKIRELLRLKYELGRSHREIAMSLGMAPVSLDSSALLTGSWGQNRPDPAWGHLLHKVAYLPDPSSWNGRSRRRQLL